MDAAVLAEHAAVVVARHPGCTWTVAPAGGPREDLVGEIRLVAAPARVALIRVRWGWEVYHLTLCGHTDTELGYDEEGQLWALEDRIALAVAALRGPTRVTLERVGDKVVRSSLVVAPPGEPPVVGQVVSVGLGRLGARLRRRPLTHEVIDLPAVPGP